MLLRFIACLRISWFADFCDNSIMFSQREFTQFGTNNVLQEKFYTVG